MMKFPQLNGKIKFLFQTTNQIYNYIYIYTNTNSLTLNIHGQRKVLFQPPPNPDNPPLRPYFGGSENVEILCLPTFQSSLTWIPSKLTERREILPHHQLWFRYITYVSSHYPHKWACLKMVYSKIQCLKSTVCH